MIWLKEVIVDIAVTVFILAAVLLGLEWMQYVLIGYTVFMLLAKVMVYFTDGLSQLLKKKPQAPPAAVIYQLYGINIAILILFSWWLTAGLWALVGLVSYLTDKKLYGDIGSLK
ncbi:MAG: hypothetical protein WD266_13660 [Balneolales bacterium]